MASNYSSFNPKTNETKLIQLTLLSQDGPKLHGHIACVHNNTMYVHGGLVNKNDRIPSNKLYKFEFQNGWNDITPTDSPSLSHHCVIVQNDFIIFIGGWNGSERVSDIFVYNINNQEIKMANSKGFPNGAGLSNHTATLLKDGRIIVFGREGSLKTQRKYGNSWILEGNTTFLKYTYTDLPLETASRSGHSNIELDNNRIMIIGGRKDKVYEIHYFPIQHSNENECMLGTTIEKTFETGNLKLLKKDPGGRRGAACVKINKNIILIHGGETFESHFKNPVDDILLLNLQTLKWFIVCQTGIQLQCHSICNLEGRFIIHGGLSANNQTNNLTYEIC